MKLSNLTTRREFIGNCGVAAAGLTLPQFLVHTANAAGAAGGWEAGSAAPLPGFKDNRILVVIQLSGGNDGLNTVIPYSDDSYHSLRPELAVRGGEQLRIDDHVAFNSALSGIKGLYDQGKVSVIEGVGYPNPDRSHFRSMEIWHTGTDSDKFSADGWIGRYFDNCCEGQPASTAGVFVGNEMPQAFAGKKGAGISFSSPEDFGYVAGRKGDDKRSFRSMNSKNIAPPNETVDFLRHMTDGAMMSQDRVHEIASKTKNKVQYPRDPLADQLSTVARMIAGELGTRIYYTAHRGFDTHANQANQQARLLRQFGDAVSAFHRDLTELGHADHVTVMVFSEFGRRVAQNASQGTDHGTAGPMFLIGDGIKGGLHGARPSLTDLDNGDLKHTTDFRAVYASVLRDWFEINPRVVLGRDFPKLGLIA